MPQCTLIDRAEKSGKQHNPLIDWAEKDGNLCCSNWLGYNVQEEVLYDDWLG